MYHPTVIAARESTLLAQPAIQMLFPRGFTRHAVGEVQQRCADLEKILSPKGQPSRALTPSEDAFILNEKLLGKIDFAYWAERYAFISIEARGVGPLYPLWASQQMILAELAKRELLIFHGTLEDGIFVNILKSRQLGASTLSQALLCHRTTTYAQTIALLASDVPDSSDFLFDMQERLVDHLPWFMRPTITERKTNDELVYGTGSRLLWGAGKSTRGQSKERAGTGRGAKGQLGRGKTLAAFHGSEISTWDTPEQLDDALFPAMPAGPLTLCILESSAKGRHNWWHQHWDMGGRETPSGLHFFGNIFLPWYVEPSKYRRTPPEGWAPSSITLAHAARVLHTSPHYCPAPVVLTPDQMYWYESTRADYEAKGKFKYFLEEFCADADEAYQHAGMSIFTVETLERIQQQMKPPVAIFAIEPKKDIARVQQRVRAEPQEASA